MLDKIIFIKNVGRFWNSAAAGNPQLAKHTPLSTPKCNTGGRQSLSSGQSAWPVSQGAGAAGALRALNVADDGDRGPPPGLR